MLGGLDDNQKRILWVLTLINVINYADRQLIFPLFGSIKAEFGITDFQLGLLGTYFLLVHSLASVPLGYFADRFDRRKIIAGSLIFWTFTSFFTGMANNFKQLLHIRTWVGVGEAGYAPAAAAMITDDFDPKVRGRVQGIFNSGMFIGGTIGTIAGAWLVSYFGDWRLCFFIVSPLGLLFAGLVFKLKDHRAAEVTEKVKPWVLFKIKAYLWILLSGIFVVFASGGYLSWAIEYFTRKDGLGMSLNYAATLMGLLVLGAGALGIYMGSAWGDKLQLRLKYGRSIVIASFVTFSAPLLGIALYFSHIRSVFLVFFFLGITCFCAYLGPITAVIHDVTPKQYRATAYAVYLFVTHTLGDALAPALIGRISDMSNLKVALAWTTVVLFAGGLTFFPVAWMIKKDKTVLNGELA